MSDLNSQIPANWSQVGATVLAFILAAWGVLVGVIKLPRFFYGTFLTIKTADKTYLKKMEDDNTFSYVLPKDFAEIKEDVRYLRNAETISTAKLDDITHFLKKGEWP